VPGLLALTAATLVLGSPNFVMGGAGFGTERPSGISNGGDPSGMVNGITWSNWGAPAAFADGRNPIFKPQGGYFDADAAVRLRADNIGTCPDGTGPAYTQLSIRFPNWPGGPLGPWVKWAGARTICSIGDTEPGRAEGICDSVGSRSFTPGTMFDIAAVGISCSSARRAASTLRRVRCAGGCSRELRGLRCRLHRLVRGELAPNLDHKYPAQRVSCTRSGGHFTAWLALPRR
jgi:hypothetical protein